MSAVLRDAATVCGVLVAVELLSQLCEETELLRFVRGAAILLLLASFLVSLARVDFTLTIPQNDAETRGDTLTSMEELEESTKEQYKSYLTGLLGSIGLQAEKIELFTTKTVDGSIVLDKAELTFAYEADRERAAALLHSVLPNEIEVMTYAAP